MGDGCDDPGGSLVGVPFLARGEGFQFGALKLETPNEVRLTWGIKIPLRDGVRLNATLYLPPETLAPSVAVVTLTPYVAQTYHAIATSFARRGLAFVAVDVRGRGNSEGKFKPFFDEAHDGHDVIEWVARQPFCSGRVVMWGGSYAGYNQWVIASTAPHGLATIVPTAAPYIGLDFPSRGNIPEPYWIQWLTLVAGRTSQQEIFRDAEFWRDQFRRWSESGRPFRELDRFLGHPSATFQEWTDHASEDEYWDAFNPRAKDYAGLAIPVLTITGICDGNQPGALRHHAEHYRNTTADERAHQFLVIGPWDHAGTRLPAKSFAGLDVGPESVIDLIDLHVAWYAWSTGNGPRPEFLRRNVAYYVMGRETWRYADRLEDVTSGVLPVDLPGGQYVYDPADLSHIPLESTIDHEDRVDQRMLSALHGKHLVFHTEPFAEDFEVSGFFRLEAWLSIDQPDTDFKVSVHEVDPDGRTLMLANDLMRARHRRSPREAELVRSTAPLLYTFKNFTFVSRLVPKGHRLRLVLGAPDSIHFQRNYNSGGVVADECRADARRVTVRLHSDGDHRSVLYVPIGQP